MAGHPKKRIPRAAQGERRSHLALKPAALTRCPQCHNARLPHTACPTCGYYKTAEAVAVKRPKAAE